MARPRKLHAIRKRYLPQNLDLGGLADKYPPQEFGGKSPFLLDRAAAVVEALYRATERYSPPDDDSFGDIPSAYFKGITSDYQFYLSWLIRVGVLECNNSYRVADAWSSGQCKGYRFAQQYRSRIRPQYLADDVVPDDYFASMSASTLSNGSDASVRLIDIHSPDFPINKFLPSSSSLLCHYVLETSLSTSAQKKETLEGLIESLQRITIDPAALDEVWGQAHLPAIERNARLLHLHDFNERQLRISLSGETGRLYTPVTQMKRDARRHLTLDGCTDLDVLDVKTCHPLLMIPLARRLHDLDPTIISSAEIDLWTESVLDDDLYDVLARWFRLYCGGVQTREMWKRTLQRIINGPIGRSHHRDGRPFIEKEAFAALYPGMMGVIRHIKTKPTPDKDRLWKVLQQLEAEIMLWHAARDLILGGIPVLTIHDAIIVRHSDAELASAKVIEAFEGLLAISPTISAKALNPSSL